MLWFNGHPWGKRNMIICLPLLILAAPSPASIDQRYSETVYETDFGESSDTNYDNWPDDWTRRRGPGFPHYVDIRIEDAEQGQSEHAPCLRVELNGGGATAYSPPIEIDPLLNYIFQGRIKAQGLTHDVAYFTVSFFDKERTHKETYTSRKLTDTPGWQVLRIGPLIPENRKAKLAVIGVHVVPTLQSDLTGTVMFDDLRLARLPHMTLDASQPDNLYTKPCQTEVTCTISGIEKHDVSVLFELLDVKNRVLSSARLELAKQPHSTRNQSGHGGVLPEQSTSRSRSRKDTGYVAWHPQLPGYGFFTVRASLLSESKMMLQRTTSLSVLRNASHQQNNEFGWSLEKHRHMLTDEALVSLLKIANASWVKYPLWYDPEKVGPEGDRIAKLIERFSAENFEVIGVLDEPPKHMCQPLWNKEHLTAAEALLEPGMWQPTIDPLLVRYSLKIQHWQLGADGNQSFINYHGLKPKLTKLRAHVKRFGQRKRVGLAWNWMHAVPEWADPPWDFLAMTESPSFTHNELATHVTHPDTKDAPHWVTLRPLPRSEYDIQTRARDLILRMTEAKINDTEAIFLHNPCDQSRGLLHEDGTPGELFLPWCITARMIGGATYLGSLQLPNKSPNHVFAHNDETTMVVWNETPVTESIYLGDHLIQTDPWGRETVLTNGDQPAGEPRDVAVGPVPTFVKGLDPAVAQWRLNFSFEPKRLHSVFGDPQSLACQFKNTFTQGIGGTLKMHMPNVWDVGDAHLRFKLGTDEDMQHDFNVRLNANASSGPQPVSVDFKILADKPYQFKAYREIKVGMGTLTAELNTWLDDQGKLIVEQHLINQANRRLDFDCYLFVPGRRRLRMQVFDIGPGRVTHTYALKNGKELLGQPLWLRVEELEGERLYNYHVVAEP